MSVGRSAAVVGAVALFACLTAIYAAPRDAYWIADCGNKALMAQRLLATRYGDLHFDYPAAAFDPTGAAFPIRGFAVQRDSGFISIFAPAYPALAAPFLALVGPAGLRLPAALGVGASAVLCCLWLAPGLGRAWAIAGGLVLALATPLCFYGATVWEHSLTVALSLGAWLLAGSTSASRCFGAGLLVGAACWLREELALMALALVAAAALGGRRGAAFVALSAGAALPIAALVGFNSAVYGDPLGLHVATNLAISAAAHHENRATEAIRQVVAITSGYGTDGFEATLLGVATAAALGIGAVAAWRDRRSGAAVWGVLAIGLGAWALGISRFATAERPFEMLVRYNGMLIQVPLFCTAGIGGVRIWRDTAYTPLRLGATAGVLFLLLAIGCGVAFQPYFGFGVHWGPRALLPAIPALVAAFAAALRDAGRVRWLGLGLVAAGALSTLLSLWFLTQQRADGARLQAMIRSQQAAVLVTTHELLGQQLASLWGERPLLLVQTQADLVRITASLRSGGVRELLMLMPPGSPVVAGVPGLRCRPGAQHRGPHLHYLDLDLQVCRLTPRA